MHKLIIQGQVARLPECCTTMKIGAAPSFLSLTLVSRPRASLDCIALLSIQNRMLPFTLIHSSTSLPRIHQSNNGCTNIIRQQVIESLLTPIFVLFSPKRFPGVVGTHTPSYPVSIHTHNKGVCATGGAFSYNGRHLGLVIKPCIYINKFETRL